MKTLFANTVFEFPTRRKWISPALKLFHRLNHSKELCVKLQTKPYTTETVIEPETANQLPNLKHGDIIRIKTDKEKTWNKKGSLIAPNDRPRSYNALKEKCKLIIRRRLHLVLTNE